MLSIVEMELLKKFIIILALEICLEFEAASLDATIAENLIEEIETDLIKEQKEYKDSVNATSTCTTLVRSQIKSEQNLKKVVRALDNVTKSLRRLISAPIFDSSIVQNSSLTLCRKTQIMIANLESDVVLYLRAKLETEENATLLSKDIDELKIQYFANFIFFNKNQSENVLAAIAMQERLVEKCKFFASFIYASTVKTATVLYDIKVIQVKNCETKNITAIATTRASSPRIPTSRPKSVKKSK